MKTQVVTSATGEPVDLEEVKLHLRLGIGQSNDDILLKGLISAARQRVENYTNRKLMRQTWKYYIDDWPDENHIELPYAPLLHVTSSTGIVYKDSSGSTQLLASTNASGSAWREDTVSMPGKVILQNSQDWPTGTLYDINPIGIQFICGYGTSDAGDASKVPESMKLAVKMLVGHWYENREASIVSQSVEMMPEAVQALLYPYRVFKF